MNIQGLAITAKIAPFQGNTDFKAGKTSENENGTANVAMGNNQKKYIENLQEQINQINSNEKMNEETKKKKVAELQKMIAEAEIAMQAEAAKQKEEEVNKKVEALVKATKNSMTNQDGDSFEVSQQAILLLNAGVSLDSIRAANGTVTKLEGERKVLAAEQEMDASRKVSGGGYKADKIAQLDGAIASAKQTFATALQEGSERAAALAADTGAVEKDANEENEEVQRPEGHTGQEE